MDENLSVDGLPNNIDAYTTDETMDVDPVVTSEAAEVFEID